ncbi:MAG: hypothetical protein AAF939_14955, partial [Planctomycetota bacterium]
MATVIKNRKIPKTFRRKLSGLRAKLTAWLVVHGVGRWLLIVLAILAADIVVDRVFRMDGPQRLVMLMLMGIAATVYFLIKVVKPLLVSPNDQALLYEVENKNPQLAESLISGYELSGTENLAAQGISPELVQATIDRGLRNAEQVDFGTALDRSRNSQNWIMLLIGLLLSGGLVIGVSQTNFLNTWFQRNILLTEDQWPQSTYLDVVGADDGRLVVPRGNDHRQLVVVTEDSEITDVSITIEVENPGGRTLHQMKPTGKLEGREHMFMFHNVSSEFRFRASGGDDVTEWINVELVEPPAIIDLNLQVQMPDYTGTDVVQLDGNGPFSVLTGSRLTASITTNKPLSSAAVSLGEESFEMSPIDSSQAFEITIGSDESPLRGGEYVFSLADQAGLSSSRQTKIKLTIKDDEPPKARASLLGITGLVSSRAMLPTSYQVGDDYGLVSLGFDMNWKTGDSENEEPKQEFAEFKKLSQPNVAPILTDKDVAVLDLMPMNLPRDTSFRFSVLATDNHPEIAGQGRSTEFLLRVVSDEELRGDLLRREIEQRKAFDQAFQAQTNLAAELQAMIARKRNPAIQSGRFDAQREAEIIELIRTQKGIGTAIFGIAERFEEFLVEVKNNRLDEAENELAPDQRIETRFDEKI